MESKFLRTRPLEARTQSSPETISSGVGTYVDVLVNYQPEKSAFNNSIDMKLAQYNSFSNGISR